MANIEPLPRQKFAAIAPAIPSGVEGEGSGDGSSTIPAMPYSCQTCARRKVKCDKAAPICSSCRKGKLQCSYQAPPPRRKRKYNEDVHERLARYEGILQQHGLMPPNTDDEVFIDDTAKPHTQSRNSAQSQTPDTGTHMPVRGKPVLVDNHPWRSITAQVIQSPSDEESEEDDFEVESPSNTNATQTASLDPLSGAFIGTHQTVLQYHPTHASAMALWNAYVENVEPLCKILHRPSVSEMVSVVSKRPETARKAQECLLFSIYHFAVYSMTDEECWQTIDQPRGKAMQRFHFATRQALVNASFLKSADLVILQALVLFLLACRHHYDPQTYWILTGVAFRIGQRIGVHRDGKELGMKPFEVEMRRRLFYQLLPLDGVASHMSGRPVTFTAVSWDTLPPSNINDDQMWPEMTVPPVEQDAATEMIFILTKACLGSSFIKIVNHVDSRDSLRPDNGEKVETLVQQVENEVERRFIRYCDIVDPLHLLTIGFARAAISAMRLRLWIPRSKDQTISAARRDYLLELALKILETDTTTYSHPYLRKFFWYVNPFFFWGSWDSLIFVLTCLERREVDSKATIETVWKKIEMVYSNHKEFLQSKRALHVAVGRLTLRAWAVNPSPSTRGQPDFILILQDQRQQRMNKKAEGNAPLKGSSLPKPPELLPSPSSDAIPLSTGSPTDGNNGSNLDAVDWIFWDQLIRDYEAQSDHLMYND